MKQYLKLIRIKHWLKNFLVFLPLFFNGSILNITLLIQNTIAFLVFCISSSIVYIINDICDLEKDKNHPINKDRPLVSGKITVGEALFVLTMFIVILTVGIIYLYLETANIFIVLIPLGYILINILYSKGLKNVAIIDVLILVIGFVLRVVFGAISVNVVTSTYLYLMIIFGSYYLSFGKRRGEIIKNGDKSRLVLSKYSKAFLDKNMYVAYGLSIVSYTLWCVDPEVTLRIGHNYLFLTVLFLMTILQLYSLDIEKDSFADPVDIILSDKLLILTGIAYIIVMALLIYL